MYGSGSGGDWGSVSAEDLEQVKQGFARDESAERTNAALECMFRFFREWMSTMCPDADAMCSVSKEGLAVGTNQAGWNIDWSHDMKQWSEGVQFDEKATPRWDGVDFLHEYRLADAAVLFKTMPAEEINARLAPVAVIEKDYGETGGCEGGRRLEVRFL
jgi:hypothetical protein